MNNHAESGLLAIANHTPPPTTPEWAWVLAHAKTEHVNHSGYTVWDDSYPVTLTGWGRTLGEAVARAVASFEQQLTVVEARPAMFGGGAVINQWREAASAQLQLSRSQAAELNVTPGPDRRWAVLLALVPVKGAPAELGQ